MVENRGHYAYQNANWLYDERDMVLAIEVIVVLLRPVVQPQHLEQVKCKEKCSSRNLHSNSQQAYDFALIVILWNPVDKWEQFLDARKTEQANVKPHSFPLRFKVLISPDLGLSQSDFSLKLDELVEKAMW